MRRFAYRKVQGQGAGFFPALQSYVPPAQIKSWENRESGFKALKRADSD